MYLLYKEEKINKIKTTTYIVVTHWSSWLRPKFPGCKGRHYSHYYS